MVKYIIKRVLIGLLTLIVLVAITFAMTKVMPGSPLQSKKYIWRSSSENGGDIWIGQATGRTVLYLLQESFTWRHGNIL